MDRHTHHILVVGLPGMPRLYIVPNQQQTAVENATENVTGRKIEDVLLVSIFGYTLSLTSF